MIWPIISLLVIICLADVLLIFLWKNDSRQYVVSTAPMVSILIAARDEEVNILRCLRSLAQQNYPADKIQILIGDDSSTDRTYDLAQDFINLHTLGASEVVGIESQIQGLSGKANVLAQLAHKAAGEIWLITDADMSLPSTWISTMVAAMPVGGGIVTGVTISHNHTWQSLDWLFAIGMVKVLADRGKSVTTMGNNMAISKTAYHAVGGYETIPFSITEDLELFKAVDKAGYEHVQLYRPQVLVTTQPVKSFFKLLQQRKRWMRGAVGLAWPIVVLLFLQAVYFPLMLLLLYISWKTFLVVLIVKTGIQAIFLRQCAREVNFKVSPISYLLYEPYSWLVGFGTLIYYLLPVRVNWKGRKY